MHREHHRARRRRGSDLWIAGMIISWIFTLVTASAANPQVFLQFGTGPVQRSEGIEARAFFVNTNSTPIRFAPPDRIPWRAVAEKGSVDGAFERVEGSATPTGEVEIQPGAVVTTQYRSAVPAQLSGTAFLEVPMTGRTQYPIEVGPEPPTRQPIPELTANPPPPPDLPPTNLREEPGQTFFRRHFSAYEPMYFVWGPKDPNAKFQISIRYRIMNPDSILNRWWRWTEGLHVAYTQTSLWDLDSPSAPFFDSSYKPELHWRADDVFPGAVRWWEQLGLQAGVQHESNGKGGEDSRSLNILYVRPTFLFGDAEKLFLSVSPRAWVYLGGLADNPDLKDYRGYADLFLKGGWGGSLQLAGTFRVGDDFDRASMQLDLTYPTARLFGNLDLFLHLQYFNGWGESLIAYDERSWAFRVGLSLFR